MSSAVAFLRVTEIDTGFFRSKRETGDAGSKDDAYSLLSFFTSPSEPPFS